MNTKSNQRLFLRIHYKVLAISSFNQNQWNRKRYDSKIWPSLEILQLNICITFLFHFRIYSVISKENKFDLAWFLLLLEFTFLIHFFPWIFDDLSLFLNRFLEWTKFHPFIYKLFHYWKVISDQSINNICWWHLAFHRQHRLIYSISSYLHFFAYEANCTSFLDWKTLLVAVSPLPTIRKNYERIT